MKRFLVISSILILAACNTGLEINTECVLKHTAEMVKFENTAGDIEEIFVNLSWTWVYTTPNGDGVIVERQISSDYDSIGYVDSITSLMTFTDTSDLLEPNLPVSYRLGFLVGKSVDYFDTTDFTIPGTQHFVQPDTEFITITNDTLIIEFTALTGFDETDVAIYKTSFTDIDSIVNTPLEELLEILTNPLIDTTVTGTQLVICGANALIETLSVHMIKISSSKMGQLEYITDTSIGLRAFIKIETP
ncbi:MAG: hypothetical protein WBB67_07955 [bacterium]